MLRKYKLLNMKVMQMKIKLKLIQIGHIFQISHTEY